MRRRPAPSSWARRRACGAGKRKVQPGGDAALEYVQMLGQGEHGLHHVQSVDEARVERGQSSSQKIRLFLVVPFQANPIAGLEHPVKQVAHLVVRDLLAPLQMRNS